MLIRHTAIATLLLLSFSLAEAGTRVSTDLTVTSVAEIAYQLPYSSFDVAASPNVVLAVWVERDQPRDDSYVYAQRFSRADLSPIGKRRLLYKQEWFPISDVNVIHDGEKFVVLWAFRTDTCCNGADLWRVLVDDAGNSNQLGRVAFGLYDVLDDVLWDGSELIVSTIFATTVLNSDHVQIGYYEPLSDYSHSALAAGTDAIHAVWQTANAEPGGCSSPQCPVHVETAMFAFRSAIIPTDVVRWNEASNELVSPDIAAIDRQAVVTAQRTRHEADRDDIVAFSTSRPPSVAPRADLLLGVGHSPAVASFGRRFAFAWLDGPVEGTASTTLSVRVADMTLSRLTGTLSIPLGSGPRSYHEPKVIEFSEHQFLVAYQGANSNPTFALISAERFGRARIVRPSVPNGAVLQR